MDGQTAFYRDVLGLAVKTESPYWTALDLNGIQIGLHASSEEIAPTRGWIPSFLVDDVKAFRTHLEASGVQVDQDFHETPRGTLINFRDPEGNPWQAMQLGPMPAEHQ